MYVVCFLSGTPAAALWRANYNQVPMVSVVVLP
jgi:hypothetical protein